MYINERERSNPTPCKRVADGNIYIFTCILSVYRSIYPPIGESSLEVVVGQAMAVANLEGQVLSGRAEGSLGC